MVFKAGSLRNCYVKKVKFLEIFRKNFKLPHKTLIIAVLFQNLTPKIRNLKSGFFPDFPDTVFSGKKNLGEVGGGQTLGHFLALTKISCFIFKLELWHDVADAKTLEI